MKKVLDRSSREGKANAKVSRLADYRNESRRVDYLYAREPTGMKRSIPGGTEYIYMSTFGDVS
jgi:hypothetical protein